MTPGEGFMLQTNPKECFLKKKQEKSFTFKTTSRQVISWIYLWRRSRCWKHSWEGFQAYSHPSGLQGFQLLKPSSARLSHSELSTGTVHFLKPYPKKDRLLGRFYFWNHLRGVVSYLKSPRCQVSLFETTPSVSLLKPPPGIVLLFENTLGRVSKVNTCIARYKSINCSTGGVQKLYHPGRAFRSETICGGFSFETTKKKAFTLETTPGERYFSSRRGCSHFEMTHVESHFLTLSQKWLHVWNHP